jgi:hypothetical protein
VGGRPRAVQFLISLVATASETVDNGRLGFLVLF